MNAKKIMGAVLVALLALTAFAGVAAAEGTDYGTVFIYQKNTALPAGVWSNGDATVTVGASGSGFIMPGDNFVAGKYTLNGNTVNVVKPTVSYAVSANLGGANYIVANGGNVFNGSAVTIVATPLNTTVGAAANINYYVTFANGTALNITKGNLDSFFADIEDKGTYKIQAFFNTTSVKANFYPATPFSALLDEKVFSFTVIGQDEVTISASSDTAFSGDVVKFTLAGAPGKVVIFNLTAFNITLNQKYEIADLGTGNYSIKLDNEGKGAFEATVNSSLLAKDAKKVAVFKVVEGNKFNKDYEIQIKITAPVVSGTVGAASYFIGDKIVITGTSTLEVKSENTEFNISGINYDSTKLNPVTNDCEYGKTWKIVLPTAGAGSGLTKNLDVGTYTISMIQGGEIVATFTVNLKQPFISIISAPEVVAQGSEAEFVINAEATGAIHAFIFGTNHFAELTEVDQDDKLKNQFTVTMSEEDTEKLATGQYFMVFQHPMYDQKFNVTQIGGKFYQDYEIPVANGGQKFLFDALDRQTANAAQALCDALDSQNFDDMYVKYSFFIVGQDESFSISEIPTTVAQGETITISGVDTANAGETIQVTMLSTAFAAVPKETTGSAAFILVTTEIAEDGTWEVTLDTSSLAIDEYNLAVKIQGEADDMKNVRINVVEAGDEPVNPEQPEEPEQPEQPEEPVAPATPGFGALAALAGLGAVAVLLLRRE